MLQVNFDSLNPGYDRTISLVLIKDVS